MNSPLLSLLAEYGPKNDPSHKLDHSVGRVTWQTLFDDQPSAYQLQEDLSHWSKTALNSILEEAFQYYCPAGQIWRIGTLELDLGEIPFDELAAELPKRVRACLSEQLSRLLLDAERQAEHSDRPAWKSAAHSESQLIDRAHSLNDYVDCFLRHGIAPWWHTGDQDNTAILLQQLQQASQQIAAIIRNAGQTEAVRKRIVWQYRTDVLKKIVEALEPVHHDYIVSFADQLTGLQARTHQPHSDRLLFERQSWFWILTHLLVDRGSLFNTMAFVESTLKQMALHYRLDYLKLLQQLTAAAQSLEYKGQATPQFIQALLGVQQKALSGSGQHPSSEQRTDYWQLFAQGLRSEQQASAGTEKTGRIGELFTQLAEEDAEQMTALLKKEGQKEKIRHSLIAQLNQTELSRIVQLLAPQNHLFILDHARQSREVLAKNKTDEQLVWEVILAYLLKNSGSYFNRRQFVDKTLQQMSQARGIDYLTLLDMLCATSMSYRRFELLAILGDLKLQNQTHEDNAQQTDTAYCRALAAYLGSGQVPKVVGNRYLPSPEQLFAVLLHRQPRQLASMIASAFNDNNASRQTRIQRLLALIQPADFALLLHLLDAEAAQFATGLIDRLNRWQRQLPSLGGFDVYYRLHGVALSVLIAGRASGFSVARFMSAFFAELAAGHGIAGQALAAEMLLCATQDNLDNNLAAPDSHALRQWLATAETGRAGSEEAAGEDTLARHLSALLCYLREDKAGLQRLGLEHSAKTLSELLPALLPDHADALLDQLQHQRDRNVLTQALLQQADRPLIRQWLDALWPDADQSAAKCLSQWQNAIAQSGLWKGSTHLLQQKLHDIFWLSVLDQALVNGGIVSRERIDALLADVVRLSCRQLHIRLDRLNDNTCLNQAPLWQTAIGLLAETGPEALVAEVTAGAAIAGLDETAQDQTAEQPFSQDAQGHYLSHPLLPELCRYLLLHGRAPLWLSTDKPLNLQQMIADLLRANPLLLRRIIQDTRLQPAALFRLHRLVDCADLLAAVAKTSPELKPQLTMLKHFYSGLLHLRFAAIDPAAPAALLWQRMLQAWLDGDWQRLSAQHIAAELSGELIRRYPIEAVQIEAEFKRNAEHFPAACSLAITRTPSDETHRPIQTGRNERHTTVTPINKPAQTSTLNNRPLVHPMPIQISNAGLVLLQGFIPAYFNRLELTKDRKFADEQAQRNAVHYLQYLATGFAATEEQHLVLNKLLCGLEPASPIEPGIELTSEAKELGDSLIQAAISHWSAIGSCSVDGFRGNWLVRNGLLSRSDDRWDLIVEKRAYDLLLQRAPFSYHLINFPWMAQPLYVTWPT